jgi:hypothetical protein
MDRVWHSFVAAQPDKKGIHIFDIRMNTVE